MRMVIITALAVVATAVVLWSHPGLRDRAQGILLAGAHRQVTAQASAPEKQTRPPQSQPDRSPDWQTPPSVSDGRSQAPGTADGSPRLAAAQTGPVRLPPPLDGADFGMTRQQLERAFDISWHGEDYSGSQPVTVLAHYMTEDRRQLAKFRLVDGELRTIEVNLKPDTDQPLDDLYQTWRDRLAEQHEDAPAAEPAGWADQRVSVRIGKDTDRGVVWIRYSSMSDG